MEVAVIRITKTKAVLVAIIIIAEAIPHICIQAVFALIPAVVHQAVIQVHQKQYMQQALLQRMCHLK